MKVCVIGGGASGMVCAIRLARRGIDVTILEKNNSVCKKVLATGNGKCNYFNDNMSIDHYRSSNNEFLESIISSNINKVHEFFDSIGVVPRIKNGYYYPFSNTATTIKNLLLLECNKLGINIISDTIVYDIIKDKGFIIKTNNLDYKFDKVVMASGSCASIKDDYNGYKILKKLGHNIIKPLPALVMLEGFDNNYKDWAGIRVDVSVSLYEDNNYICKYDGEVQLTNYGISGICVMNLSGRVSRIIDNGKEAIIRINFIPNIDDGYKLIDDRNNLLKGMTIIEILESIINYKLLYIILKKCHIDTNLTWNELSNDKKMLLIDNLFNFEFVVRGSKGFECAQVVSGGVDLNEVNNCFESRIINGLYIIGELLDVDGDCGGYNLGFAWISGMIVGDNL